MDFSQRPTGGPAEWNGRRNRRAKKQKDENIDHAFNALNMFMYVLNMFGHIFSGFTAVFDRPPAKSRRFFLTAFSSFFVCCFRDQGSLDTLPGEGSADRVRGVVRACLVTSPPLFVRFVRPFPVVRSAIRPIVHPIVLARDPQSHHRSMLRQCGASNGLRATLPVSCSAPLVSFPFDQRRPSVVCLSAAAIGGAASR